MPRIRNQTALSASVALLATLATLPAAFAQRGPEIPDVPSTIEPAPTSSRFDGFPSTFNAAMVEPGDWNLDILPVPNLTYGLERRANLRLGLVQLGAFAAGGYGASGELRYRVWDQSNNRIVASIGGSMSRFKVNDKMSDVKNVSFRTVELTITGEHRWSAKSASSLTLLAGGFNLVTGSRKETSEVMTRSGAGIEGAGLMLSHAYFPARWFGMDAGVGVSPWLDAVAGGTGGSASIDLNGFTGGTTGFGGRLSFHVRTAQWLMSFGTVVLPPVIPVPVIGVSTKW
jgi:hypothetical protein